MADVDESCDTCNFPQCQECVEDHRARPERPQRIEEVIVSKEDEDQNSVASKFSSHLQNSSSLNNINEDSMGGRRSHEPSYETPDDS